MNQKTSQLEIQATEPSQGKKTVPDVETMKKAILAQITDVSEQDLNVMEYNQILSFYNQLIQSCVQQGVIQQAPTESGKDQIVRKEPAQPRLPNNKTQQINIQIENNQNQNRKDQVLQRNKITQNDIVINGVAYYIPKALIENSYFSSNKKFKIISCPKFASFEEKRQAVMDMYSPEMAQAIKQMKNQQVDQIFNRLRFMDMKQGELNLKNYGNVEPIVKQFCVNITYEKLSKDVVIYNDNKNDQQPIKQTSRPQIEYKPIQQEQICQFNVQDQFFDQYCPNQVVNQEVQNVQKQKQKPINNQPSLKQTLKSLKQKQKVSASVQTQKFKNQEPKTKSKITIISQTQYIEETDSNSIEHEFRPRPSDIYIQQQTPLPYKIKTSKFRDAILNPGATPQPQILEWIRNMKETIGKFEHEYLSQFKQTWIVND